MGLDMYLYLEKHEYKSEYVGGCTYPDELASFQVEIEKRNFKSMSVNTRCQVGYWRKANAIHNWFVNQCANGVDECQDIYVGVDKLEELLNTCKEVINNPSKASELLPTTTGFFFGSQNYDYWYFNDLKYSIDIFQKVFDFITSNKAEDVDYTYAIVYSASW